jgi:hypothetical protein
LSLKQRLRTLFVCLVLEAGLMVGVPVRAEQVAEVLRSLSGPKIAHTRSEEQHTDGR